METIKTSDGSTLIGLNKRLDVKEVQSFMTQEGIVGMYVHDVLDPIGDLGAALANYSFLEQLSILTTHDHDWSFLENFKNLTNLSIRTPGKNLIDLSSLSGLQKLSLAWRPKIHGLSRLVNLKDLWLIEFREKNLESIECLTNLDSLIIHTASIQSLKGIEHIQTLKYLELGNCRNLKFIGAIDGLSLLNRVHLDMCTRVEDFDQVVNLPSLDCLIMINCKDIPSIGFILNFKTLEYVALTGNTNVIDGDLKPLLSIRESHYSPRKHYKK